MTPSQVLRSLGFAASLEVRGVTLTVNASSTTLSALVEDASMMQLDGEVAQFDQKLSRIHVLNCPEADAIKHGDVFNDAEGGLKHTVCGSEPFDIKTVFRCVTEKT